MLTLFKICTMRYRIPLSYKIIKIIDEFRKNYTFLTKIRFFKFFYFCRIIKCLCVYLNNWRNLLRPIIFDFYTFIHLFIAERPNLPVFLFYILFFIIDIYTKHEPVVTCKTLYFLIRFYFCSLKLFDYIIFISF